MSTITENAIWGTTKTHGGLNPGDQVLVGHVIGRSYGNLRYLPEKSYVTKSDPEWLTIKTIECDRDGLRIEFEDGSRVGGGVATRYYARKLPNFECFGNPTKADCAGKSHCPRNHACND
jgi:hypothetical protein